MAVKYPGPTEALEAYEAAVAAAGIGPRKGAKMPYTSLNGHMYSFLDANGVVAVRLSDDLRASFAEGFGAAPVKQYGGVMRGYVSVREALLADTEGLAKWLAAARDWIATLPPKPTK